MGIELLQVVVLNGWFALVRIPRWAGGNVLIDGRCFVVPADAEARVLGQVDGKVHAEDSAGAGLSCHVDLAFGSKLLGYYQFDLEVVRDFGAVAGLEVAGVFWFLAMGAELVDQVVKFEIDDAVVS